MSQEKKERVGILMPPSQVAEIDALYPLHGHASRSDFVCKAVEFYTGFLQQSSSEFYMNSTTLAFLEEQLDRLENRICRQLFRICVEQEMACHMFASQCLGEPKETLEELRKMDGEPVYMTFPSDTGNQCGHWALVGTQRWGAVSLIYGCGWSSYESAVETLGAKFYRRPPEGEEHCYG